MAGVLATTASGLPSNALEIKWLSSRPAGPLAHWTGIPRPGHTVPHRIILARLGADKAQCQDRTPQASIYAKDRSSSAFGSSICCAMLVTMPIAVQLCKWAANTAHWQWTASCQPFIFMLTFIFIPLVFCLRRTEKCGEKPKNRSPQSAVNMRTQRTHWSYHNTISITIPISIPISISLLLTIMLCWSSIQRCARFDRLNRAQ